METFGGKEIRDWSRRCKVDSDLFDVTCEKSQIVVMPPLIVMGDGRQYSLLKACQSSALKMIVEVDTERTIE